MNNANNSAFPLPVTSNNSGSVRTIKDYSESDSYKYLGLTKREYFAAKAMQGFLAFPGEMAIDEVVEKSVRLADKVLAELEK